MRRLVAPVNAVESYVHVTLVKSAVFHCVVQGSAMRRVAPSEA